MNRHTLQTEDQHQQILLLLPWYLNQSLDLAERQRVESHLRRCILCRRELIDLDKLATALKQASDLQVAAEASFNGLREKLQIALPTRQRPELFIVPPPVDHGPDLSGNNANRHKPFWAFLGSREAQLAIAASLLLAIIPLAMHYGRSAATSGYYTLSDAKPPESIIGPQLRVVFSKSISDTDIKALLVQIHGQRVAGPNTVGAYTVRLGSGEDAPTLSDTMGFLRKQQNVMLAEPVLPP